MFDVFTHKQLVNFVPHGVVKELNYISKMSGNKTDVLKLIDWSITLITSKHFAKMLSELLLFIDKNNVQNTHMEKNVHTGQYTCVSVKQNRIEK